MFFFIKSNVNFVVTSRFSRTLFSSNFKLMGRAYVLNSSSYFNFLIKWSNDYILPEGKSNKDPERIKNLASYFANLLFT
jgi:hypothetical protein